MGCPNLKYLGLILNVGRWDFVNHFDDITLRLGASKRAARPYAQPPRFECRGEVYVHDPVWGLLWGLLWGPSVKWGYPGQPPNKGEIARVAEAAGLQNFMGIHVSYAALTEIIPAEYVINVLANTYTRVKMIREGGGDYSAVDHLRRKPASEGIQTVEVWYREQSSDVEYSDDGSHPSLSRRVGGQEMARTIDFYLVLIGTYGALMSTCVILRGSRRRNVVTGTKTLQHILE